MQSKIQIRKIKKEEFKDAVKILDAEIGERRARGSKFLSNKYKKYPQFFFGLFLNGELIGVVGGFPREDYLLMSELAIDSRFHRRGFGGRLVTAFEKIAKVKYNKINVGAENNAIGFYNFLNYTPFLLIQFKKKDYSLNDFEKFNIFRKRKVKGYTTLDIKTKKAELKEIDRLKKKYPKAHIQYIFTKKI